MSDLYVGIDQSYSGFGLAFFWPETGMHRVVHKGFDPKKTGSGVARLNAISVWLMDRLAELDEDPAHICIEGYNRGARNGREESGELGATVKSCIYLFYNGLVAYPTIVPPTSLKKYVTGRGTASKSEMLLGVYKKWGAEFQDDNEADAYALARLAYAVQHQRSEYRYEAEVLNKLQPHTEMSTR